MELLARLKRIAPEFALEDEQFLLDHLTISQESISSMIRQPLLDNLIVYLAAHNIDLALKRKGSGGQVKSIREGALSIDYAVNSNITSEFDMSSYGGKYMALVKSAIIAPLTRSC
jgi:hypothetical protein